MDPLRQGDALLLVDVQNDFMPDGALPVPAGDEVVSILNGWIAAAAAQELPIFATRDWHPANHFSFEAQGGPWPVHCVQNSSGARFHPDLHVPENAAVIDCGTGVEDEGYSAFEKSDLDDQFRAKGISRVWVGGLALDVCVRATALDASHEGFDTIVILPACRAITPEGEAETLKELHGHDIGIYRDAAPPTGA